MKLSSLNFMMTGIGELNELSFDCPRCGPPFRICIHARLNGPAGPEGVWAWSAKNMADPDTITIQPSINNANHGKKKSCGWHGSISEGEVKPK